MNDRTTTVDHAEEEILAYAVSDEALEAAAAATGLSWSDPWHCHRTRGGPVYGC